MSGEVKLLLVEDFEPFGRLVAAAFETVTFTLVRTARAAVAADVAGVDGCITDLQLPDGSGWRVAAALRERRPRLPILVLTGDEALGACTA